MPREGRRERPKKERPKLYPSDEDEDAAQIELGDVNSVEPTTGKGRKKDRKEKKKKELYEGDDAATQEVGDENASSYEMQLKKVTDTQDSTIDVLHGIITMNEETIQIGTAAAERLAQQREKLNKIKENMDDLESGLARGKKEVNAFMRGLACDKCLGKVIIIVVILIATGILTLTIMRLVKPDIFDMKTWIETAAPTVAPQPAEPITPFRLFY